MMKLLLASSSFMGGGISSYAQELVACYVGQCEMSVMIGDDSLCPLESESVKVYHYEMSDTSENNAQLVLALINDMIKPDVIVNSCAKVLSLLTPFLDNNIKVITVSHSLMYDEADYAGFNSQYADVVIALSGYAKSFLDKKYNLAHTNKVKVVPNFVRKLENREALLEAKLKNPVPIIVFTGGGTAAKAPEIVFEIAYKLLKADLDFKFYWLGTTTPPFKKILPFKEIKDILPNDPRLIFTGRIPRDEAVRITNRADIFLSPSRREGCPMALLETLRIGAITITSDYNNGCKEIIKDGINGFVIPHLNKNEFVKRVIDIIQDKKKYINIYEESYSSFLQDLSFETWQGNMNQIILSDELTHEHRRPDFDSSLYKHYRKQLETFSKANLRHMLLHEYLPSALPFFKYYLRYKLDSF